jgi:glycosyltransferase involved in cell wall biosynthesis
LIARSSKAAPRVAFLVKNLPLTAWISDQVLGLTERGVEVKVLAKQHAPAEDADPPDPAAEAYRDRIAVVGMAGGRARRAGTLAAGAVGALSRRPVAVAAALGRAASGGAFGARLAMEATAWKATVLHAHFGNYAASILPVRRIAGLPLVVSFYGWDASAAPLREPRLYEPLFKESACVVALSREMRDVLARLGCPPEKIEIVHVAVRGARLRERAARGAPSRGPASGDGRAGVPVVLAVGRLVEKKGLDDALDAVALVARSGVPFQFRIVGGGPLRSSLEERARRLGIAELVTFIGEVDRDRVFDEMEAADIFFLPSRTAASGDREGTPTVLIEAGALGIPSVATLHAGTPEVVVDGATLGQAAVARITAEFELGSQCERLEAVYRRVGGAAA